MPKREGDKNNKMSHVLQRGGDLNPVIRCNPVCIRPKGAAHASNKGEEIFVLYPLSYSAIDVAETGLEPATTSLSSCNSFGICLLRHKKGGRPNRLVVLPELWRWHAIGN